MVHDVSWCFCICHTFFAESYPYLFDIFWRILAVSLPVVCFLSLATCHHVDVVPIQFGFVCHPSGNRSWVLLISYKANLSCLVKSPFVCASCFSPACFSKFFHVNPAVGFLMHRFKPRRNIEKIEAWRTRAVKRDCQNHPETVFPPQTLIPILASVNFLAKILMFFWSNWKSLRSSSLSSFSSASFHSFILRQSSNLWRFNHCHCQYDLIKSASL